MTSQGAPRRREPRTLLEQLIWERNQTLAEFVEWAEEFARRHNEPGTLSERHLKRLIAGHKSDGTRTGRPRAATSRLLEKIFGYSADRLLNFPAVALSDSQHELRQRLASSRRVSSSTVTLLHEQLDATRILDRQLGAIATHEDVLQKLNQVRQLMQYSLSPNIRRQLAALLSEIGTLAGWQALDLGSPMNSWKYYELARLAAWETDDAAFQAHAEAEQAFVLLDANEIKEAISILEAALTKARGSDPTLQAWLTAAHGEALACSEDITASLRSYDTAATQLREPTRTTPFVLLDSVHLERWRGHALATVKHKDAVDTLRSSLKKLDNTFSRAETSLRISLADSLIADGDRSEAHVQLDTASKMAANIGSIRLKRRIQNIRIATELA
ncbi:hypothetical protein [Amycolatopsis magusensis]|uniref:Tetratricopeptide (TPR) repeat protein n=1 Tax=Amycolatopsis magusensis TaxID=882444 RepID=A0ABS4PS33_9PSEU|nr:hypothetical protein [Amycolatopsis magusensis]MBP2182237.1 tetratricopeptide (TPR) repeat protein [Amycolatopsis magusensis]